MTCPRCAKENEEGSAFCSRCGLDFSKVDRGVAGVDADAQPCYRHPKSMTMLSCGRCGKPICDQCVIIGPAGPRCKECAKSSVAFRPGVIGLGLKNMLRSLSRVSPWYLIAFLSLGGMGIRGCQSIFVSQLPEPRIEQELGAGESGLPEAATQEIPTDQN